MGIGEGRGRKRHPEREWGAARWLVFVYGSSRVLHETVLLKRPFQGQEHTENTWTGELGSMQLHALDPRQLTKGILEGLGESACAL